MGLEPEVVVSLVPVVARLRAPASDVPAATGASCSSAFLWAAAYLLAAAFWVEPVWRFQMLCNSARVPASAPLWPTAGEVVMRIVGTVRAVTPLGMRALAAMLLGPMTLVLAAHPVARGTPPRSPPAVPTPDSAAAACCCSSSSAMAQRSASLMPPLPSASSATSASLASETPSPAVSDSCRTIV